MSQARFFMRCAATACATLGLLTQAWAQTDTALGARLKARFEGDRTGACALDDPIEKHLPPDTQVPRQGERKILVRDLLTHSSGLPRLQRNFVPGNAGDRYADMTENDLLRGLAVARLESTIGGQADYSNLGVKVCPRCAVEPGALPAPPPTLLAHQRLVQHVPPTGSGQAVRSRHQPCPAP